jgi:hypothetical protein
MNRLLKLTALIGAGYALWRLLREAKDGQAPRPALDRGVESAAAEPTPEPAPAQPQTKSSGPSGGTASKADLYERAKALGIEGRSKMSKAELERAIRDAG